MAVDHLETGLRRGGRSHQHVKGIGNIACTESIHVVRIDGITQAELLTDSHLRRRTACQRLRPYSDN